MRSVLLVFMYVGVVAGLLGFFYEKLTTQLGLHDLPVWTKNALSWGGLALMVLCWFARRLTDAEDTPEGKWE